MAKQSGNIYTIEMNDAQMDAYEAYLKARKADSTELDALRQRVAELEKQNAALLRSDHELTHDYSELCGNLSDIAGVLGLHDVSFDQIMAELKAQLSK